MGLDQQKAQFSINTENKFSAQDQLLLIIC